MIKKFVNKDIFSSNVYVVNSNDTVILIDPGFYDEYLKSYLKSFGKLDAILLTHGHFDHIREVDKIKEDYPSTKIYIHKNDYDNLKRPALNLSYIMDFDLVIKSEANICNDKLIIGDLEIKIFHTPGHTKGSIMYYIKNENALFSGDTIMKDTVGTTRYVGGDESELKKSLEQFKKLNIDKYTVIYPGHDEGCTYEYILNNNEYLNGRF